MKKINFIGVLAYNKYVKTLLVMCILLCVFVYKPQSAVADTLSFAVSPSKVDECIVVPGGSTKIKFNVGNRTEIVEDKELNVNGKPVKKSELYKFDVLVNYTLEDYLGNEVESEGIVTFNKDKVNCAPMTADSLEATIQIPSYMECNPYVLYINFIRQPIEGLALDENNLSVIKVPVYLFVGTEDQFNLNKPDFNIDDIKVFLNDEKGVTFLDEYIARIKTLITINPKKVYNVFSSILGKPFYNFKGSKYSSFDIKEGGASLSKIIAKNGKVTPEHYIDLTSVDKNSLVTNVMYKEDSLVLLCQDNSSLTINLTPNYILNVREQMKILKNYKSLTVEKLLEKLTLPTNNKYDPIDYNLGLEISSKGKRPDTVEGGALVYKDTTDLLSEVDIQPFTVLPKKSREIKIPLKVQNLDENNYNINLTLLGKAKVKKEASIDFTINNKMRYKLFICVLLTYLFIILLFIGLIIFVIKRRNKNIGFIDMTEKVRKIESEVLDNDGNKVKQITVLSLDENGVKVFKKPYVDKQNAKEVMTLLDGEELLYLDEEVVRKVKNRKLQIFKFFKVSLDRDIVVAQEGDED